MSFKTALKALQSSSQITLILVQTMPTFTNPTRESFTPMNPPKQRSSFDINNAQFLLSSIFEQSSIYIDTLPQKSH